MTKTNYHEVATTMRNALAALPGWVVGDLTADATGWSFVVTVPARAGKRKNERLPAFTETRHMGTDGTLTVTR